MSISLGSGEKIVNENVRRNYAVSGQEMPYQQAVEAGATREELIETASVGLLMGGSLALGPIVTLFVDTINMLVPETGE